MATDSSSLAWKRVVFVATLGLITIAIIVLLVTGQWHAAQQMLLKLSIRSRAIDLQKLEGQWQKAKAKLGDDDAQVIELETQYKKLEKDHAASQLQLEGLSHEEIAAELRRRGF